MLHIKKKQIYNFKLFDIIKLINVFVSTLVTCVTTI